MTIEDKTIKKIPFFQKGSLVFKESGHTLIKDRQIYRCSEKAKNKCHRKIEKELNAKNLENRFSEIVKKFSLPEGEAEKIFDNHLIELFIKTLRRSGKRDMNLQNLLESTGNLIIIDLKAGKEYQKSDFLTFKRTYFDLIKNIYTDLLIGDAMELLFAIAGSKFEQDDMNSFLKKFIPIGEKDTAHTFAMHLRHVYISNDGHIENIEFEPFAWFLINYYQNAAKGYIFKTPKGFVTNTKEFKTLNYFEVVDELYANEMMDTYSYNAFATPYAKEKLLKNIFGGFEKLSSEEKISYLIKLNSPTKEMLLSQLRAFIR